MAQSALTVTPENPTPPTNLIYVGITPPSDPLNTAVDDGIPAFTGALASWNEASGGAGGPSRVAFNSSTAIGGTAGYVSTTHEGRGNETIFTQTYGGSIYAPIPLTMVGCGPALTQGTSPQPNQTHASSLSPATNPTLSSISATSTASGAGTVAQTATGVGFTKQSVIVVNGVPQTTTFTSSTSLTAPAVTKRATAGTWPVTVVTGGVVTTAAQTWTFT